MMLFDEKGHGVEPLEDGSYACSVPEHTPQRVIDIGCVAGLGAWWG